MANNFMNVKDLTRVYLESAKELMPEIQKAHPELTPEQALCKALNDLGPADSAVKFVTDSPEKK
jgi:hypothetical protein